MPDDWFIRVNDEEHGPLSSERLKRLAHDGRISPDTPIRKGPSGNWVTANHVKGLQFGTPKPSFQPLPTTVEKVAPKKTLQLVCPNCKAQNGFEIETLGFDLSLCCPACSAKFISHIVTVRAKRGRKNQYRRHFSIRAIDPQGDERLIEFWRVGETDIELRSKDLAAFSYLNGAVRVVQNFTIGQFVMVSAPACYLATHVYGPSSLEVATLRSFRDQVLLRSAVLTRFVNLYYRISPILLRYFGRSRAFTAILRAALSPLLSLLPVEIEADTGKARRLKVGLPAEGHTAAG